MKPELVTISTMEEEEISEEEVEEPLEEEDVVISTNGETTISINHIKEEVKTTLGPTVMAEEVVITTKIGQIMVASIVESMGTKQSIADTNIRQTWQRIHINTLVKKKIHFQKKKIFGI